MKRLLQIFAVFLLSASVLTAAPLQVFNGDATASISVAGFRNRIINGDMRVDQRNSGASQTITAAAALSYTVDRWYGYCTGANVAGSQTTISGQKRYVFTGASSVSAVGFGQRIEAANSFDMAGGVATLQAKLSSSSLTSITWTVYYANTNDTFGTLASPTRTQIATGSFTINSAEAIYSVPVSIPSSATTGIEIVFTGGALLGSQTLTIGDVQFESGSYASAFERVKMRTALADCQRYYFNSVYNGSTNSVKAMQYFPSSTAMIMSNFAWPVSMRAVPSVAVANVGYANCSGLTVEEIIASSACAYVTSSGAGVAAVNFSYTASAEL